MAFTQQQDVWNQGPLVQLPQTPTNTNQSTQPPIPGHQPMGAAGMITTGLMTTGVSKGLTAAFPETAAGGLMTGMAAAAPWLAAGYLGGKALHLFSRGTGSVPFNNPADPFGFAKGGFVNPYMLKRQKPTSPNEQPESFSGGFGGGMVKHTKAPLTARPKGLPEIHNRMLRPGGEI